MKKTFFISFLCVLSVLHINAQHWSVTWKKMHATTSGLEQIGTLATHPANLKAASPWSIGCETLDREYAEFANYKQYVGELGITSARIQSGWARCEKEQGKYDFAWLDEVVDGLREQGVAPWMCLCYGNPIYGAKKNLGSKIFTDEPTMQVWLKYVTTVVKRYKDKVGEWEIWNEPNLGKNAKYPEAYAELLIRTSEAIRSIQPNAVIIGFSLSRMPLNYATKLLDILKERGKLDLLNYVSFHPYYENPDDATTDIEMLRDLVQSYNSNLRLFQGECGCPSTLEWGHALRYYEWSEYSQAKWILRRMANDWSLGIRSSVFTFVDLQYPNMQQSFGLLRTNLLKEVVYKRPSYYAVQHMANLLHGGLKSTGRLNYKANKAREIAVSGISDSTDKLIGAMLWYSDRIPSDELIWDNLELSIDGLSIKDPVYIELITGRIYALPKYHGNLSGGRMKFTDLPLWDSPIVILERSAVPFLVPAAERKAAGTTNDMLY